MECIDARELMMLALDAELSEQDGTALEEHLAVCESCAREYAEYGRLAHELVRLPAPLPPPGLWSEVWQVVRGRVMPGDRARRPRLSLRPVFATATAVAAIVVVVSLRPQHHPVMKAHAAYVPSQHALALMHHPYTEPGLTLLAMSEGTVAKYNVRRHQTD